MSRSFMRQAHGLALPLLAISSAFAVIAPAAAEDGDDAPPTRASEGLFAQEPLPESELAATTGREKSNWMSASNQNSAVVANNHVGDNNATGEVNVSDSAFQNMSGITMVNLNTGNNSSINAAMSVNIHINYAAPAAP